MIVGIYCILNLVNGKHYVGSSLEIKRRWSRHKRQLNSNTHGNKKLQRSWLKHGKENFRFDLLEVCSKEILLEREQFWIDETRPFYNIYRTAGSSAGYKHSEESRVNFRKAQARRNPETNLKISLANTGKVRSNESIQNYKKMYQKLSQEDKEASVKRMTEARRGIKVSDDGKKNISETNAREFELTSPNGEVFFIKNLTEFCTNNGLDRSCMFRVSKGINKRHKGWICRNPRYELHKGGDNE